MMYDILNTSALEFDDKTHESFIKYIPFNQIVSEEFFTKYLLILVEKSTGIRASKYNPCYIDRGSYKAFDGQDINPLMNINNNKP